MEKLKVGTLIEDNGKLGVITKVIEMGTLDVGSDIIKWRANYEVHYADGMISIIACSTIERLVKEGKIKIISCPTTPLPHYSSEVLREYTHMSRPKKLKKKKKRRKKCGKNKD